MSGDVQHIVSCWVKGWALARGVSPPIPDHGGFRTDVGWPDQEARYVFATPGEGYRYLAQTITRPYLHLKVCAAPEDVRDLLPARWRIQPVGYMMTGPQRMQRIVQAMPYGYYLHIESKSAVTIAKILIAEHEIAAIGRVVFAGDHAVYDRIETHPDHRRKGLASLVMYALEEAGLAKGICRSVLVATSQGRALYERLGWELLSLYTTAVIFPEGL